MTFPQVREAQAPKNSDQHEMCIPQKSFESEIDPSLSDIVQLPCRFVESQKRIVDVFCAIDARGGPLLLYCVLA